jgi:DNA-binding CsgD family transcriptional regulator
VREIADQFEISANGAWSHLNAIEKKGAILRVAGVIVVLIPEGCCPMCKQPLSKEAA